MATVTLNQNVANSPTNSYPVGIFKQPNGTELQAVVLVNSSGVEFTSLTPFPVAPGYSSVTIAGISVDITTGGTGVTAIAANANRKPGAYIENISDTDIEFDYGVTITPGSAAILVAGGTLPLDKNGFVYQGAIRMYQASGSTKKVYVAEAT